MLTKPSPVMRNRVELELVEEVELELEVEPPMELEVVLEVEVEVVPPAIPPRTTSVSTSALYTTKLAAAAPP